MHCLKETNGAVICPYCGQDQTAAFLPQNLSPRTILQDRYFVGCALRSNGEGVTYAGYDMISDIRVEIHEFFPQNLATREPETGRILANVGDEARYKALMLDFVDLAKLLTRSRSLSAVIPALDVFEENNTVYTVLQYVEAITLQEYLLKEGGELSWEQTKAMFSPLISAINTIHNTASHYHLGISPETILVDRNQQLKLSGFSIEALRIAKSDVVPELYSGYAAPEQYNSANWIGPWTDVYAIAAVIYKAVTGTMPPESTSRIMGDTLLPANKLDKTIPANISSALSKALMVSPEKRTQSVEELIMAFTEKVEFEPVAPTDQKSGTSKQTVVLWVVIAICLVAVGFLGVWMVSTLLGNNNSNGDNSNPTDIVDTSGTTTTGTGTNPTANSLTLSNYAGEKLVDVEIELKAILKELVVEYVYHDKEAAGVILSQSLKSGTVVTANDTLKLIVSRGPETINLPNIIGKSKAYARQVLVSQGVVSSRITFETEETEDPALVGKVVRVETVTEGKISLKNTDEPVLLIIGKAAETTAPTTTTTQPTQPSETEPSDTQPTETEPTQGTDATDVQSGQDDPNQIA